MEIRESYTYYPKEKEGIIQQLSVSGGSEITFNYNNLRKYFDVFSNTNIQWKGNLRTNINFVHVLNEEFSGFIGKNLTKLRMFNSYNPNESIRLGVFTSFGESLRYEENNPSVGKSFEFGTFNNFQLNSKIQISQSLRYEQLRSKEDNSLFFKGYIGRINMNYQFNKDLSFRLIGEYNDFDKAFFYQPLFKWNPNPFTIFYIGGSNGYSRIENKNKFSIDNSNIYLKFQYLFDL